jgi:hypothetical protein
MSSAMKKYFLFLVIVAAPFLASAQTHYAYLAWDNNYPLSNKDWLKSGSPHGGVLGFRYFIRDQQFSIGLDLNWTTFDQYEPTRTFQEENGAITTDYYKYIYQYGAVVSAQYYQPIGSKIVFPYYGIGLGANYNQFTIYYNIYEDTQKGWGFLARPEAGVLVKFGEHRSLGAIAAVHYDYSTVKNKDYDYSGFSSFGWKIGIVLTSRD